MRPRVVVNCAASVDGKIATVKRAQTRLSSDEDMMRVRALRGSCDAIMVGVGTVIADDPALTVHARSPGALRVIVDSKGRSPPRSQVFDGKAPTLLATAKGASPRVSNAQVKAFGQGKVDLEALLDHLASTGIKTVMVEGGGTLIFSLFERHLVDELCVFVADRLLGGERAPTIADGAGFPDLAHAPRLKFEEARRMDGGVLLRYTVEPRK